MENVCNSKIIIIIICSSLWKQNDKEIRIFLGWDKRVWRDLNYYSMDLIFIHWPIEAAILVQLPVGLFNLHMATDGTVSLNTSWRTLQNTLAPK